MSVNDLVVSYLKRDWQLETIQFMCTAALNEEEPTEVVYAWFDEAADSERDYLIWAMAVWEELKNMNSFNLERIREQAVAAATPDET